MERLTLGSLFDGAGTIPLAAALCGIVSTPGMALPNALYVMEGFYE